MKYLVILVTCGVLATTSVCAENALTEPQQKEVEKKQTIKDLSDTQLKAMAYDSITLIERYQQQLKIINQELLRRQQETPSEPIKK